MSSISVANLFSVDGLVAVVTGGGSGIGLMMAKALEENGAKVYIVGRRLEKLEEAAKQAKHNNLIPLQADVTSQDDLNRIVAHITSTEGYINVLVNNSGISGPTMFGFPKDSTLSQFRSFVLENHSSTDFESTFAVNTSAVFFTTVAFLELLDAGNKKGNLTQKSQVIITSSIGGLHRLAFAGYAYGASKAATNHLMKMMATNWAGWGVRANVVAPGIYPSEMADDAIAKLSGPDGKIPTSIIPTGSPGSPEDMAGAILFLTSKAGAYLNGNVLVTDGGRLSILPATY